jgi:hypothetical protein
MSISTPTASGTRPSTVPARPGRVEGVLQQINAEAGRLVIVTDQREVLTVRTPQRTPVSYHGDTYRISNLDVGDRIRVEIDGGAAGTDLSARSIEVTQSAKESGSRTNGVGALSGRVTRVDRGNNNIQVDAGRGSVAVDLRATTDPDGKPVHARDVQAGDQVELSGSYTGSTFVATTLRFTDENGGAPAAPSVNTVPSRTLADLGVVTIYGIVTQTLADSPQLVLRDTHNDRLITRIYAVDDLPIRTKAGTWSTAARLRAGDSIAVKAYRDGDGNFIAQTVRIR